jgi:hypothetical protein
MLDARCHSEGIFAVVDKMLDTGIFDGTRIPAD